MSYQNDLIKAKILVVDDDPDILVTARVVLEQRFTDVHGVRSGEALKEILERSEDFDVLLLDMNFTLGHTSGKEGLRLLEKVKEVYPDRPVIMITAYGSINIAVKAMKHGAFDFVVKPWQNDLLEESVVAAYERRSKTNSEKSDELTDFVFESDEMIRMVHLAGKIAPTEANVLITGESGTGKDLLARYLHRHSRRTDGPFLKVDLGTVPATLFESTLFGHKKGAFTDAHNDVVGKIELANNGTLFLANVQELSTQLQAKLLSTLQTRVVTPVGSNKSIRVDFRLICSSDGHISELVKDRKFREDLFFRINTVEIILPPLRQRGRDVILLAEYFLDRFGKQYGKENLFITNSGKDFLSTYSWPGNVRQLENLIERTVILADKEMLSHEDFLVQDVGRGEVAEIVNLELVEKETILKAIRKHGGNLKQAAKELGLGRSTLYRKLKRYGI